MSFDGFSDEARQLLADLAGFDRDQFQASKKAYNAGLAEPAKAFVESVGPELRNRVSPGIEFAAKTNGSISPINNDLRFNPDASPYKDHLMFRFWEGPDKKVAPTLFVRMSAGDVGFATGVAFDKARLDAVRVAIDNHGDVLRAGIDTLVDAVGAELPEPELKRVPAPYEPDHPHGDLLRRKWLQVRWRMELPVSVASSDFVQFCVDELSRATPVHEWLVEHAI